ncbi:hypothetical protein [Actinomycetospora sp.]|jgi:hypothetical protein|uniref:hypothetical protein n=1 Tax=Actinomycetospora sp. TaxID=1872135 RepID=UPI002F41AFB2
MDEELTQNDWSREDVVIFLAEGVVCERLDVPIGEAVVALADMAVTRALSLVEMARLIVAGEVDPGSYAGTRHEEGQTADPGGE